MRLTDFFTHDAVDLALTGATKDLALAALVQHLGLGRHREGIDYGAIDGHPVHYLFLIVAPPLEISNQYLPVLGKIAQFAGQPDVPDRLAALGTVDDFFRLLAEKGM